MKIFNLEIRGFLAIKQILHHREKQEPKPCGFWGVIIPTRPPGEGWEGQELIQKFPPHSVVLWSVHHSQSVQNCRAQGGSGGNPVCEESLQFQHLCASQGRDVYLPVAGCFWRSKIIVHRE